MSAARSARPPKTCSASPRPASPSGSSRCMRGHARRFCRGRGSRNAARPSISPRKARRCCRPRSIRSSGTGELRRLRRRGAYPATGDQACETGCCRRHRPRGPCALAATLSRISRPPLFAARQEAHRGRLERPLRSRSRHPQRSANRGNRSPEAAGGTAVRRSPGPRLEHPGGMGAAIRDAARCRRCGPACRLPAAGPASATRATSATRSVALRRRSPRSDQIGAGDRRLGHDPRLRRRRLRRRHRAAVGRRARRQGIGRQVARRSARRQQHASADLPTDRRAARRWTSAKRGNRFATFSWSWGNRSDGGRPIEP